MDRQEAYRLLNLEPTSTIDDVKHAYCELVKKYHPDHNPDQIAHNMFILLDQAYKVLINLTSEQKGSPTQHAPTNPPTQAPKQRTQVDLDRIISDFCGGCNLQPKPELTGCRLSQLQNVCQLNHINLKQVSSRTQRPINKTKSELFDEIKKLPLYTQLQKKTYEQLTDMCTEQSIPIIDQNSSKRPIPKSVLELIIDLIETQDQKT